VGDDPHRYIFTVFALDIERLDLGPDASAAMAGFSLNGHILAKARITAFYERL
jgi:hypothetical protein